MILWPKKDQEKLVHAFISGRVDYCNGLLTALPKQTIKQLSIIQNSAARVLSNIERTDVLTLASS